MADNTTINSGSGGDTIATDDIGGVKYQRVKLTFGGDGTATDVDYGSELPVYNQSEFADDSNFTAGTHYGQAVLFAASTDTVSAEDFAVPAITIDRKVIVNDRPYTEGGLTIFRSLDIDESEEDVKTTAGQLYFIHAMNVATSVRYLKFYNATAANVTVGTTTPVLTFPIPNQAGTANGAGFVVNIDKGLAFATAISVACTTGVADNDTGAPGANEVIINLGYK